MISPRFTATKTKDGWFRVSNEDKLKQYLQRLPDQLSLVIKPLKKIRSIQQNRFFHGVVVPMMADLMGEQDYMEAKEILKGKFLRRVKIIGNEEIIYVRPTSSLTTKEFEQFNDSIRELAARVYNAVIPYPNEVNY